MVKKRRRSRFSASIQSELIGHFVAAASARSAAEICGVNRNTRSLARVARRQSGGGGAVVISAAWLSRKTGHISTSFRIGMGIRGSSRYDDALSASLPPLSSGTTLMNLISMNHTSIERTGLGGIRPMRLACTMFMAMRLSGLRTAGTIPMQAPHRTVRPGRLVIAAMALFAEARGTSLRGTSVPRIAMSPDSTVGPTSPGSVSPGRLDSESITLWRSRRPHPLSS